MAHDSRGGGGFVVRYDNFNPQREVVPVVEIYGTANWEKVR